MMSPSKKMGIEEQDYDDDVWDISSIVEEMDIATSMTAPNDAIKIPANKSWPTSIPVWSLT